MKNNHTPSVNIIRDSAKDFSYIPTPNAKRAADQIAEDFQKGLRAFNIIGSYGTGKSSFLLALEQTLNGHRSHFATSFLRNRKFDCIKIVGQHQSLISAFADELAVKVKSNVAENIFSEIFNRYHDLGRKAPFLLIVIDEFGKFLEYAAQNQPEKELYFIQQLAEFASNPKHSIVLVTAVHQSFESYGFGLSASQRQEWLKVKGRLKEITFNEPVEQLLYLAAEHIQGGDISRPAKEVDEALDLAINSKAFGLNGAFAKEVSKRLFPLDLFAANVLTVALQRYGQNERSLFSFLEATDHTSLLKFKPQNGAFYSVSHVFDYLNLNFYSFLASRYNPDFSSWAGIRSAVDNVERSFEKNLSEYVMLVKAVGLMNLFAAAGSLLDKAFWVSYGTTCLGIQNVDELLDNLTRKKILHYRSHSKRYILFEGTDLDIQSALIEVGNRVDDITDIKTILEKYYDLPPILAKQHSYLTGTPRYFEFVISEEPINEVPTGEVDGYINLIFNEGQNIKRLKEFSLQQKDAIVYGYYRNAREIKTLLYEIEKSHKVLNENADDKVAKRELENIIHHQRNLLNHYIVNNLFGTAEVTWIWRGVELRFRNRGAFNKFLSEIANRVYSAAPHFRNELVNRNKLSGAIGTAKKYFFTALVERWDQEDLGFPTAKFPAEKTIYLTLLKQTGLDSVLNNVNGDTNITLRSNFKKLWNASLAFLNSAKEDRRSLSDFIDILQKRPFKLRNGLMEFWLPTFLFLKRDDFALFGRNGFIPEITDQTLELISKNPGDFAIKTFNIEGVKLNLFNSYRLFLNQEQKESLTNNAFIETIKPFLIFYRQLPEYSKNTKRLSKEAISLRNAIINAKDPEKSFFEDFPEALNTSLSELRADKKALHSYIETLQSSIRELRTSYENLIDRFELFIGGEVLYETLEFEDYKARLQLRFKSIKRHLLLPAQKSFLSRIDSAIEDRSAWLSGLTSALLNKSLEKISDDEELVLYEKFKSCILELDALNSLGNEGFDEAKEQIIGLQLDSFDGVYRSTIRVPKAKSKVIGKIQKSIGAALGSDRTLNIAALVNILKDQINNE